MRQKRYIYELFIQDKDSVHKFRSDIEIKINKSKQNETNGKKGDRSVYYCLVGISNVCIGSLIF